MAQVELTLVVTDKDVSVVRDDPNEVIDTVIEAVRWQGATKVEVRKYTFQVPLLSSELPQEVTPNVEDVTSPDLREVIAKAAKRYASQNPTFDAYAALMDAVAPGTYQVEKSPGMVGIRRVDK